MGFVIIMRGTVQVEAALPQPEEALLAARAADHEDLASAGVLLDGASLRPPATRKDGTPPGGPFAEAKELIAGCTLIQAHPGAEAREWSRRIADPVGEGREAQVDVRQRTEPDDFAPRLSIERVRERDKPVAPS